MCDADFFARMGLGEPIVQLHRFTLRNFDEGLDSLLAKRHQFVGRKPSAESLGACEANSINLEAVAVEQVNAGNPQHTGNFILVTAFVVVVPQHRDHGNTDVLKDPENELHLLRIAVIG